jgi:hypothetical protein
MDLNRRATKDSAEAPPDILGGLRFMRIREEVFNETVFDHFVEEHISARIAVGAPEPDHSIAHNASLLRTVRFGRHAHIAKA